MLRTNLRHLHPIGDFLGVVYPSTLVQTLWAASFDGCLETGEEDGAGRKRTQDE